MAQIKATTLVVPAYDLPNVGSISLPADKNCSLLARNGITVFLYGSATSGLQPSFFLYDSLVGTYALLCPKSSFSSEESYLGLQNESSWRPEVILSRTGCASQASAAHTFVPETTPETYETPSSLFGPARPTRGVV